MTYNEAKKKLQEARSKRDQSMDDDGAPPRTPRCCIEILEAALKRDCREVWYGASVLERVKSE